jgi:hypothetical protein
VAVVWRLLKRQARGVATRRQASREPALALRCTALVSIGDGSVPFAGNEPQITGGRWSR